ncbi:unnamed protein product [Acanthoscelides obtectus]|uniref:Reverse transcriptase domain-containing protein n=1 Tax=Acanthoscelides obtectus TaxID=200917 RepID=A0A9P0PUF2_ACAOB|nr:unnamed protein product [Acanthoscelides obtectus]CAK1650063.1 hypothetical protein AOBTE_LOCUS16582 [Acanthoscelides obtectus]
MVSLSECAFADDLMICAEREKDLQTNLELWNAEIEIRNLKINVAKSKVMVIGKNVKEIIKINNNELEQVNIYKYLGIMIQREGSMEAKLNERINKALKIYHTMSKAFLGNKKIRRKSNVIVYKTIFRPTLIYGSEGWVLSNRLKSKIHAAGMKFLRKVKGITRRDKIRNDIVRSELGVEPILHRVEVQQLRWFGDLNRSEADKKTKSSGLQ